MAFIQILDFEASSYDEISALDEKWRADTEGRRTLRRSIIGRDRNNANHYVVLAFFDDYESAMVNSALPETGEFASKLAGVTGGAANFLDLEVIEDKD